MMRGVMSIQGRFPDAVRVPPDFFALSWAAVLDSKVFGSE